MPPSPLSPWLISTPDERRFDSLVGTQTTDVVVIGAGIVGCMAAWHLSELGVSVVLLEKNHIAGGDTGYTTAFITRVPDTSLTRLASLHGQRFVNDVFAATSEAQRELIGLIQAQQIDCDFKLITSFESAYQSGNASLAGEWDVVKVADLNARWAANEEITKLTATHPRGLIKEAIAFANEGRFDARKFLVGLMDSENLPDNLKVFEESEVTDIRHVYGGIKVSTAGGTIRAKSVIVATGLPINLFRETHLAFKSKITYALEARFTEQAPIGDDLYWDTFDPYFYYRRLDEHTVILGGADHETSKPKDQSQPAGHDRLKSFIDERFEGDYVITNTWSGSLFETVDGLPYVDWHPHHRGRVIIASGLAGNGMVMGTMIGRIAAELAAGKKSKTARLFSFARNHVHIPKYPPEIFPKPSQNIWAKVARIVLPITAAVILITPAWIFYGLRGGFAFLSGVDLAAAFRLVFPVVGLYAFTLVYFQLMIGSNRPILQKIFPRIVKYHRIEGAVAFTFAWLHPLMILIGYGAATFFSLKFRGPEVTGFVLLGFFQLGLINLTVFAAWLRRKRWFEKYWHAVHLLNYAVFVSVWIHSWFLGSDVQSTPLRWLWIWFAGSAILSVICRIVYEVNKRGRLKMKNSEQWTNVANLSDLQEDRPFCANANGVAISIFKIKDQVYAVDNTCTHAGGPLCEGSVSDTTITCPWHGSKFDFTNGKVINGPARIPVRSYQARINGDRIEIQI